MKIRTMVTAFAVLSMFLAPSVFAQDVSFSPAIGGGSHFAEEDETFDTDNLFASVQLGLLGLPVLNIESGVAAEVSYAEGNVQYSFWSLNRAPVAGPIYGGTDMKVAANAGAGTEVDFDVRVVVGYKIASNFDLEIYSLEDERPLAFSFLYRF